MAKYTLRPSVFLLYKMVGELVSDFLLNSYKRGCQSISIELRRSDLLNWSESQKLIDMFKKITLLSKSTNSSNDIILDLYLTPCDNNIASHQRELYLLENATNRLSLQKKYVLKMIFVKLSEYIRSEASRENIFLQPIYYLFILNHVCVPKMLFSDDNMNIFARGIKLVLEANINMPFFNLEDVQNQSFYPLMQRVFDIFLVFNILVDNGDNTYSWHNYVPGEPIFNILRRNPIVKGMFFFLCCATNIIKVTIKLTKDGKSYSNKTNIHRYLQVYFPEMTEKKIKNTEDRFRKEVKEYWEKHQIQKDSYYDIVISYIKDYVENVYNKKKDKKKKKNKLTENDIVIGISGSGNSKNVVNAIEYARECGAFTVGITGYDGGIIKKLCDLSIHFPINDMQIAEDLHLILNHMSMRILKEEKAHENLVN